MDDDGIRKRTPAEWASWLCDNVPAMRPVWGPEDEALIEWAITVAIKQSSLWPEVATSLSDLRRENASMRNALIRWYQASKSRDFADADAQLMKMATTLAAGGGDSHDNTDSQKEQP